MACLTYLLQGLHECSPTDFGVCGLGLSPVAGVFPPFFAGCGVAVCAAFFPSVKIRKYFSHVRITGNTEIH